jgi:hypothetical protein
VPSNAVQRLVSLRHPRGLAGVLRDPRGALWLDGGDENEAAVRLHEYEPGRVPLTGGRMVAGGALPPVAARAEVLDGERRAIAASCARGVWLAVVDCGDEWQAPLVRFRTRSGVLVPRPQPSELARSQASDAIDACPACGAVAWDRVTIGGRSVPGLDGAEPEEIVACRRCGHAIEIGTFYGSFGSGPGPARETVHEDGWDPLLERNRLTLSDVHRDGLALYRARGRPAFIVGAGGALNAEQTRWLPSSVTIADSARPSVSVRSAWPTDEDPISDPVEEARGGYWQLLMGRGTALPRRERSEAALTVWLDARERAANAETERADLSRVGIPIDGDPVEFTLVGGEQGWAAACDHGATMIRVLGSGVPIARVELVSVADATIEIDPGRPPAPRA